MPSQYIERLKEYVRRVEKERDEKVSYAMKHHRYSKIEGDKTLKGYFEETKSRSIGEASGLIQALKILDEIFPELEKWMMLRKKPEKKK